MQKSRHIVESAIEMEVGFAPVDNVGVRDVVISTQIMENYGAHDWDGNGVCPQYWKFKGGNDYILVNVPVNVSVQEAYIAAINSGVIQETDNEYYREYVAAYKDVESGYQTWFEKSQMEYEGEITCPANRIEWDVPFKG